MITAYIIFLFWFIISCYRIKKANPNDFNPFENPFVDYMGFMIGGCITLIGTLCLIFKILP